MKQILVGTVLIATLFCCLLSHAQEAEANANSVVPTLVNFSGTLTDLNGKPITTITGVTFLLYKDEQGGAPLWMETQNITPNKNGYYTAVLGTTTPQGLPTDLFASGEARWLAVQAEGQPEQPRVLLLSVPYALKAGDAQTLGGLPASAFMLAAPVNASASATSAGEPAAAATTSVSPATSSDVTTTGGTASTIPMFTTSTNVQNSILTQTGTTAINVAGKFNLPATGTATSSAGKNSQAHTFAASAYNSSTSAAVAQTFQLQAEPAGNDTSSPSGTLNVLFGSGTSTPAETGLKISDKGLITFATGQTFPGTGTITGITTASGSGLSGGGTTGTLSLSIPSAGVTNTMLKNSSITLNANSAGGLTTPGAMTLGSTNTIGLKPCSANQILEYSGTAWNCSATGTGTITGVTAGTDLTGGGTSGKVTLNLDTTKVPLLASANIFSNIITIDASSVSPGLMLNNSGVGDGMDVSAPNANGISVLSSVFGIYTSSTSDGSYFVSSGAYGSYAQSDYDSNLNPAVYGVETGPTEANIGVWGVAVSPFGIGTYGETYAASKEGSSWPGTVGIGVWGDSSGDPGTADAIGVLATVDYGFALTGYNNTSGGATAWLENDEDIDRTSPVLTTDGGSTNLRCVIDVSGDLTCDGTISPAVPINNGAKKVAVYGVASAESWLEDAGSGRLSNGSALVNLDETFAQTVNTGVEYHVFLTPNGDCKGLYVGQKSATSFEVHELGGGASNIAFDYRIMAKRRGFETVRLADRTKVLSAQGPRRRAAGAHFPNPDDARKAHAQKVAELRRKAAMLKTSTGPGRVNH